MKIPKSKASLEEALQDNTEPEIGPGLIMGKVPTGLHWMFTYDVN